MTQIYIQFNACRRLLACGFFPPQGLVGLKLGQTGSVLTALVLDAPAHLTSRQIADLFLATRIDPPCFLVSFADLGPGWTIAGQALTLTEAAALTGRPRNTFVSAVRRGDLPTFKLQAKRSGKDNREHLVNSLDLDRYIKSQPRKPETPPAPPKKRGRPTNKKSG
jgi:hypothetical protein